MSTAASAPTPSAERGTGRQLRGVVVSDKMDKTIVVEVTRRFMDTKYKKFVTKRKKFKAHDESNQCRVGDEVQIAECRPLSRDKRFRLRTILKRAV